MGKWSVVKFAEKFEVKWVPLPIGNGSTNPLAQ